MGMNCDNPNDEFNFGGVEMILPPQMKTVSHILKITLIRAENLIDMDTFGSIDPFVTFEFGSSRYKTKKINDN
jgi:Ca2+-dependent lipid-binding protein